MKCATVYKRKEYLYFHPRAKTEVGVWIAIPPFHALVSSASPLQKGDILRQMLYESREGVEHPTQWGNLSEPLYKLAGVKTWGTFAKITKCCEVEYEGDEIRFIPHRNLGPKEGFVPIESQVMIANSSLSNEEIGLMVDAALEKCE